MVVMHISDLHFGIPDSTTGLHVKNREMILDTFFDNLSCLPNDLIPDVLVITGDIGYSGSENDYIEAKKFITKIIEIFKGKITTNDIIICPGNHDVYIPPKKRQELRPLKDNMDISNIDALTRQNIEASTYKFENYVKFLKDLNICELENRAVESDDSNLTHYLYGYRELKGIQFVVLNSEWDFFGKKDKNAEGCLRLGADLVADALESVNENDDPIKPIIAIFHRPIVPNIHISERNIYKKDLQNVDYRLNVNTDIILNGHVHIGNVSNSYGSRAWTFSCGTLHSIDVEEPEFWLFKFDNNNYQAIKYKWNLPNARNRKGIWKRDIDNDCNEKIWTIGQPNSFSTEESHFQFLDKLIANYNDKLISKTEAIEQIQNNLPTYLHQAVINLFNKAISNASNKNTEISNTISKGFEKELTIGNIDITENLKEDKTNHE